MSLAEIYLPQAAFVFSIQCVTRRSRLRVLLHFADNKYNFGVLVSKRSQGASRRALNKLRFPRQSVRSMPSATITSNKRTSGQLYGVQVARGSFYSQPRHQGISKIFPAVILAE